MRRQGQVTKLGIAKAVDLRKAYKQLAVSSDALVDSYLCILNPEKNQPEAFGCRGLSLSELELQCKHFATLFGILESNS